MLVSRARFRRLLMANAVAAGSLLASTSRAQLHWDASAQVGVAQRVLTNRPPGGPQARFGPAGQLAAHVALFPLVRFGAYVGQEISPMRGDGATRDLTWAGVRTKILSPWPRGALRAWLFAGFGYSGLYARSTSTTQGAGGGFFEVPFGLGASRVLRKPFALAAELGMRAGFGERGSVFAPSGTDRFAIAFTVGVLVDL